MIKINNFKGIYKFKLHEQFNTLAKVLEGLEHNRKELFNYSKHTTRWQSTISGSDKTLIATITE